MQGKELPVSLKKNLLCRKGSQAYNNYTRKKNPRVVFYPLVSFWLADTGHPMGGRNVYCEPTLEWGEINWLATLTAVPLSLGSNPGEDMDACKCIMPSRHGDSRRAASPLLRLVELKEQWEATDHLQGVLPQNWG
ncbi:uncharacterized protein TNCV_2002281 [Trichonephila clavipes]|nr:uncharacterized protein TNCV_2002281 [Trichonephila clavipes]